MELMVCLFNSTHLRQVQSNAFLDCLEEGAMDYLLFSQGSGDPAEILLIQLSPGKPWTTIWSFLYFLCKVAASYCRGPRVGSRSCSGPPCPTRWGKLERKLFSPSSHHSTALPVRLPPLPPHKHQFQDQQSIREQRRVPAGALS